jgi:superfamily II DNA/RNA helicase
MCRYLVLDETDKMTEIGLVTSIFGPHTLVVQGLMYRYLVVDETDQMIERVEGLMGTSTQSEFSHLLQQE